MSGDFNHALEKATNPADAEQDWEAIILCVDLIRAGSVTPNHAISCIRKKLDTGDALTLLNTLVILDSCVKNCGSRVHMEIASKEFMAEFWVLAVHDAPAVRAKALEIIQTWARAFADQPAFSIIGYYYEMLKQSGANFPAVRENDKVLVTHDPYAQTAEAEDEELRLALAISQIEAEEEEKMRRFEADSVPRRDSAETINGEEWEVVEDKEEEEVKEEEKEEEEREKETVEKNEEEEIREEQMDESSSDSEIEERQEPVGILPQLIAPPVPAVRIVVMEVEREEERQEEIRARSVNPEVRERREEEKEEEEELVNLPELDTDYENGLKFIPLRKREVDEYVLSAASLPLEHPWRDEYEPRGHPPLKTKKRPDTRPPPPRYKLDTQIVKPQLKYPASAYYDSYSSDSDDEDITSTVDVREIVRLVDVEAFREQSSGKFAKNGVDGVTDQLSRLNSKRPIRPVIYRYCDSIKCSFALLEAIHFELFMPDRPDLRFLAVPLEEVPEGTMEGDYFRVRGAEVEEGLCMAVELRPTMIYPVIRRAFGAERMEFGGKGKRDLWKGLAYITKKQAGTRGGESAINAVSNRDFFIRDRLFPDEDSRQENSIVRVTQGSIGSGAWLYPVEPPLPPPERLDQERKKEDEYGYAIDDDFDVSTIQFGAAFPPAPTLQQLQQMKMQPLQQLQQQAFDPRSAYLKLVEGTVTSSLRVGRVVTECKALSEEEAERIEDRLGQFDKYGQIGDLRLMDELFRLGCRYRESVSSRIDEKEVGEMRMDESVILKTVADPELGGLDKCRRLLDCIYKKREADSIYDKDDSEELETMQYRNGEKLNLNKEQSRAVRWYADAGGPRVFCILSPPGSGKTTVAAAMAAEVSRGYREARRNYRDLPEDYDGIDGGGVQLLMSVQNVAVDNIGEALKKMNYGGGLIYNMKSTKKMDAYNPAPFDYFDSLRGDEIEDWKKNVGEPREVTVGKWVSVDGGPRKTKVEETKELSYEEAITTKRRDYENRIHSPRVLLSTVDMTLQKFYTRSKLVEPLGKVSRIIIDEASLLTEAALFAIIRRFPKAQIVLIGDENQLPPFMYDPNILGHELAGRPALSVAMKTGRVPVVRLREVYRAPPSLIEPYNRLAYGGTLVSRKPVTDCPLSVLNLVHAHLPQLLLIDVNGEHERSDENLSLGNRKELATLRKLLDRFPPEWKNEVMIICLYKEQRNRLQQSLGNDYTVFTVDSAQGKERSIVILMTTRTSIGMQGPQGFFYSKERCNVAVSRQQKALIILGKASFLSTQTPWSTVVNGDDFTRIDGKAL